MSFHVNSISVITPQCKEFALDVMQRSAPSRAGEILFAGVYNCRKISGSASWSQHSYGNAVDMFAHEADLERIADNAVRQATEKTWANRGDEQPVHYVIWREGENGIWSPERGWHNYSGYHPPTHVHVDFLPERNGRPSCAS
jgi:hypothetical protein